MQNKSREQDQRHQEEVGASTPPLASNAPTQFMRYFVRFFASI